MPALSWAAKGQRTSPSRAAAPLPHPPTTPTTHTHTPPPLPPPLSPPPPTHPPHAHKRRGRWLEPRLRSPAGLLDMLSSLYARAQRASPEGTLRRRDGETINNPWYWSVPSTCYKEWPRGPELLHSLARLAGLQARLGAVVVRRTSAPQTQCPACVEGAPPASPPSRPLAVLRNAGAGALSLQAD